ncbi:mucin-binding protein [Limosilactobacillus reuteri]
MLSRNNWKEQVRQQEPKKQRFTIKKLTIGVASVLIGFTFMGMSASADAQTTPGTPAVANANTNTNASSTEGDSNNAATHQPAMSGAKSYSKSAALNNVPKPDNTIDTTTPIAPSQIVPSYDGTKVVDTPFYNNPQGTNSKLIDNQSKTGQYTFYFTAKDASGKEYASSYAAEKNEPKGVVLNSILDKDAGAYDPNSLEYHFYYQNNTDQDQTINYTLRMADYLNPYKAGRPESSLVPDGSRISDVKVTSKQGNTYDISSVTTALDGVKSRDGDLRYVGDVPVNLTVKANDAINLVIPFVLNTTAKKSTTTIDDHNEFSVRENGQQTGYMVVRSSTYAPLYSEDKIYPLVNVGNNNYTHDYPDNLGAFTLDPSVYRDEDFMNGFWEGNIYNYSTPTNKSTVYGSYTNSYLLLDKYEDYLTKHGFSVAFSNGKPVPYYMYQLSKTGSKVVDKNGNPVQGETKGHPYFEVVPVILLNQDETYTTNTALTAWDPSTMVNKVADPTNYRYWDQKTDSAVRMDNTAAQLTAKDFKVTIIKDGQAVKPDANGKYDLSKPGIYTVTYSKDFNGTTISNSGQITVTPAENTTVTYTFYDETDNKKVEGHDVTVTGQPGTDQKVKLITPEGYKLAEGQTLPTSVTMPEANETITIHLVHATKDNQKTDTNGHTVQFSWTFDSPIVNLHRTTDDNTNIDVNNSRINTINFYYDWDHTSGNGNYRKTIVYKLNADGTKFVNTTDPTDSFDASGFKYEWRKGYAPNTKFGTGTGTVLAQNNGVSNPEAMFRMNYTITDPSVTRKLNLPTNFSTYKTVLFNFWGATTNQTLTFNQNQDISNLSQAQYRQLINVTDLGANGWNGTNVDPSTPQEAAYTPGTDTTKTFSMAWAPNGQPSTATVADGVKGTVRINFNDGTYLDVPATINVVKNNADQYMPAYKAKTVAANSSVDTGSPSFTKDSKPVTNVPGHTYAFNDGTTKMTINDKNGKNPVTVTINKTGAITFTAPDDATEYDIPVTVTYKDGSSNTATAKVFVNKSLDPTKVDPTNPEYKEMFKTVTRDIVTTSVSGQQTTKAQSLDFGRTMTIYGNGDPATYGKWEAGKLSADKFTTQGGSTEFASENITPVDGYTSYYKIGNDGQKVNASAVPSASALDKDGNPVDGTTVYVGYATIDTSVQIQVTFVSTLANLHRTTDDNTNIDVNNSRINTIKIDYDWDHTNGNGNYRKTIVYKLNTDGTKFVNTTDPTDSFDASAFKYEWRKGYAPNTKFGTGTGTVLAQNNGVYNTKQTYQMNYTITDPSVARKLNLSTNYSSSMRVYFNFWGATTNQTLTFNQNQDISNLSQAQYRQLIDVTDLGANGWNGTNVDPSTPQEAAYTPGTDATKTFSMAWAPNGQPSTATVADGVKGTVRINFNDGTYLDVPATINVVKNNADQYMPAYKAKTVAANSSVDTGSPSFTKDSKPVTNVPGHTYAFNDGTTKMTINDKNGKNPVTVTINKTGAITFTAPDDATEYDIPVTVTYKDGSSNTATAKVFVNKSLDPTKVDPTNPEYKEMFKTVTRDIVTTSVSGQQTTKAQSLDFGRTMTIYGNGDPAAYGKWEAGKLSADKFTTQGGSTEFASENITPVDGYTSYYKIGNDGQKVNASAVPSASALDKDGNPVDGTTVYVGYDKNNTPTPTEDTTVTYTFYDETDKKPVEGHDVTVTGQPGTDQKVNLITPEGYKLAEGQTLPTSVTMPKANETITINLVHATKDIKPNDPGVNPSDPAYADMFKTVTRDIVTTSVSGQQTTEPQVLDFGRTMTIYGNGDPATYGKWEAGKLSADKFTTQGGSTEFASENITPVDGYTSYYKIGNDGQKVSASAVPSASALDKDGNPVDGTTVYVGYDKNNTPTPTEDTTVTYTFYDETDKKPVEGHDVTVTGQPGTDQKVNLTTPEGYKLAEGQTLPTSVTMPKANETITINLVHATKDIKPNDPGVNPSDPAYADMFKTVTRDIVTTSVSGQQTTEPQVLDFGRTMTIYGNGDPATYGKWEVGKLSADKFTTQGGSTEFASENITPVDGYTSYYKIGNDGQKVSASAVPSASALDKDGNPVDGTTVYVGYDKNNTPTPTEDTTVTYTFYDDTDKKLVKGHDVTVTGQPGTDQKVNLITPEGYKLAEGQTLPTSVTMPKANETITINLVHATKDIKPNDPGVNPSDPVYADMFKTVTRTIKVNNPDRMVDTTTQQVNFNRTKTIDEVTDEVISYGNWTLATGSAKDWGQFNVPQLDGFISYVDDNAAKEVAEENVTADTADVTVEVTYKNSGNNGNNTTPGDDGSHNTNPGDNGSHNTNPGDNGSHNTNSGDNGNHNTNPGDNGSHNTNPGDNGSHNTNPGDNGSHNTNPGDNGSHNTNPGDNGSHNTNPGDNGSHNTNPGDNGSHNTNPGDNGSHNTNPGDNGSHNTNPGDNGSHNTNPGDNGNHNTNPGDNGSHNTNPGDNGSHNTNPGDNGSHNTNPGDNGSHNTNPGDNGSHNTNPGDNGNHNANGNNNGINNGTQNGNGNKTVNTNVTDNSNGDNGQNNKQALPQTGNTKNDAAVAGLGLAGLLAMLGLGGLKKKRN